VPVLQGGGLDFANAINYSVNNGVSTIQLPFTFGSPFEAQIYFYSLAQILTASGWTTGASATADFSNTAILSGISVRDSLGNPVDFSITSASGTSYTSSGVVPEPATLTLMTVGLAGLSWVRRRHKMPVSS
jgi:hypothetical protein